MQRQEKPDVECRCFLKKKNPNIKQQQQQQKHGRNLSWRMEVKLAPRSPVTSGFSKMCKTKTQIKSFEKKIVGVMITVQVEIFLIK